MSDRPMPFLCAALAMGVMLAAMIAGALWVSLLPALGLAWLLGWLA